MLADLFVVALTAAAMTLFIAEMQQIMKEKPIFVGSIENFDNVVYNFNDQEDE